MSGMEARTLHQPALAGPGAVLTPPASRTVVLYNPQSVFYTMPLALLAVGSQLDARRYSVVIVDGRLETDPVASVVALLDDAVCLGITVLTGAPIRDAIRVSRAVKAVRPDLPVVWGGWHPSMFGRECLAESSVDVTVQGQGEETFAEIVDRLAGGDPIGGCAGCAWRGRDGGIHQEPARALRPVDAFRPHDYSMIPVERYFALKGRRQLDYISSQGCQFRCAFCADPFVYARQWVGLPPDRVVDEIEALHAQYGFTDVNFQDETFFTRRERVESLAAGLLDRGLGVTWAGTMRADQGARLPEPVIALCRRAGLRRALIGVESGSPEMLERIRKDTSIEQVFESAHKIRRHGIAGQFPFIVGFPGESDESVHASLDVARRLREMSPRFQTPFFYFKPYPGTEITADAVRDGYRLPATLDEWSDFDFVGMVGGPWVSADKFRLVERFKYYQQVAYDHPATWRRPIARLARWRCRHDAYAFPVEMRVSRWMTRAPALS